MPNSDFYLIRYLPQYGVVWRKANILWSLWWSKVLFYRSRIHLCGTADYSGLFDVFDEPRWTLNQVTYTITPIDYIIQCAELICRAGYEFRVPRTPDEFAMVWRTSYQYSMLMQELEGYENEYPCDSAQATDFAALRRSQQVKHLYVFLMFWTSATDSLLEERSLHTHFH